MHLCFYLVISVNLIHVFDILEWQVHVPGEGLIDKTTLGYVSLSLYLVVEFIEYLHITTKSSLELSVLTELLRVFTKLDTKLIEC